jgi:tetratricopeptide (TPR) repeat protein
VTNRFYLAAVVAVAGFFGTTTAALAAEKVAKVPENPACPHKNAKKVDKALSDAQKARDAKNWDEMLAKANEADAMPVEKTEYDKYLLHELRGVAYASEKKYADAVNELDGSLNSPCYPEADKNIRIKVLMQLSYQAKDYDKAIQYGSRHYAATGDLDTGLYLANAYYIKDDYENTRKTMGEVISKLEANGTKPEETAYRILQSACLAIKDNACVNEMIEKLVANYPKPEYYQNLISSLLQVGKTDKELLNILRLADGMGIMRTGGEYIEMADHATAQGLPGEAQYILEKGLKNGAFTSQHDKDRASRALTDAKTAVTLDKSSLDQQDATARAKATGDSDVKLGAAYLSYGMTDKAIEALKRGMGKGGVKDPDEAGLLLGIAYLRSNNKEEAANAFRTVTKSPLMTRIAKLWLISGGAAAG